MIVHIYNILYMWDQFKQVMTTIKIYLVVYLERPLTSVKFSQRKKSFFLLANYNNSLYLCLIKMNE